MIEVFHILMAIDILQERMGEGSFEELMFGVRRARTLVFAATASLAIGGFTY